jgi:thioredoxin-dependent peroxiredoxin
MAMLTPSTPAPAFALLDQQGNIVQLQDFAGLWLLICFYPKDATPVCTKELCAFRDQWHELRQHKCAVIGMNADTVEAHKKFAANHELPFPLLADPSHEVLLPYEAWLPNQFLGLPGVARISYLVDPQGNIAKAYAVTDAPAHAAQVLQDLLQLQAQ